MTRGRHRNTAHLVAKDDATARQQWVQAFSRDRADLGPNRAATIAEREVARYGSVSRRRHEDHHYMRPEPSQGYGRVGDRTRVLPSEVGRAVSRAN